MEWFIITTIIGAAVFGGQTHELGSRRHFATEAECRAYMPADAAEVERELESIGAMRGSYTLISQCATDPSVGTPA